MARAGADAVVAFDEGSQPPSSDGVEWVPVRHIGYRGFFLPADLQNVLRGADLLVGRTGARVVRDGLSWDQVGRSWLSQMEPLL